MEKVLKNKRYSALWITIIILQFGIILMILGTGLGNNWASGNSFKSGLVYLESDGETNSIIKETEKACKEEKTENKCKMLKNLIDGGSCYLICSGIVMFLTTVWIVCSIGLMSKRNMFALGCICGFSGFGVYMCGVFLWIIKSGVKIGECRQEDYSGFLCLDKGFGLNIGLIVYIAVVIYLFFVGGGISLRVIGVEYMTIEDERVRSGRNLDATCMQKELEFNK